MLLVADALGGCDAQAIENHRAWRSARVHAPRASLVLLRPESRVMPIGTAAFLEGAGIDTHYHVAMDSPTDFARLARCLSGAGIGLVLGGGGARGFAHVGVLRALNEEGVPIDWVGGTSIGSIIAGFIAQGSTADESLLRCRRHFRSLIDLTLPLVSLISGRRIRSQLDDAFGEVAIEDLPLPYLCVSTNLTRATQAVHERGTLVHAIRASISLPGILPPMRLGADLYVDGGLVNNLPIDLMAAKPEIGMVIAVDVSADTEMGAPAGFEPELSGWRVFWEKFFPRAGKARPPAIMSVLTRSSLVASMYWARESKAAELASLYVNVPLADLRLLAFERIDDIATRGYEAACEPVRAWWATRR